MQLLKSFCLFASAAIAVALPQPAPAGNVFTSPVGGNLQGLINIAWTPGTPGTVSLFLVKGPEGNQKDEIEIAKSLPNTGAFNWAVPVSLQDSATITDGSKYAFRIQDDITGVVQYSAPFELTVPGSTFVPSAPAPGAPSPSPPAAASTSPAPSSSTPPASSSSSLSSTSPSSTPVSASSSTLPSSTPTPSPTDSDSSTTALSPSATEDASSQTPATPSSGSSSPDSSSSSNIGVILGATFGSLFGLGLLIVVILVLIRKRRAAKTKRQMRSSGFQRGMEEVEREHAEYMRRVAEEQGDAPPSRQPSTKQGGFMGTAF